jgi:patatin-like phospholipase/acyl hydrolase
MSKKFRILSLDGGGLRGIIPVLVLKEIEKRTGKRITDMFDLIAGTSTGALIACGITVSDDGINPKYTLNDIERIYTEKGKEIFPKKNWLKGIVSGISSLKNPKFSEDGIQKVLHDLLGEKRLSDCIKPVFAASFDLYNNEALLFKYRQALSDPTRNARLIDICRATSAAPTYLPAYNFTYNSKTRICVDGGIYMNNPAVGALVEVTKYHKEAPYNKPDLELEDISILSIGTGHYSSEIARKKVEGFGLLDWATNITDVMMQAVNQTSNYQAEELISDENFIRVNVDIDNPKYSDMADSADETRDYLIQLTNSQVLGNSVLMDQIVKLVTKTNVIV